MVIPARELGSHRHLGLTESHVRMTKALTFLVPDAVELTLTEPVLDHFAANRQDSPDAKEALDGFKAPAAESNAYRWLRHLVETLQEGESPREFLEHTKLELFHDQVFCFTPKGKLIALPRGATPIDFAYAVHTSVGDSCVGAKVNGSHAPLVTELKNGDEVDIIRSEAQTPPAAWEGLAVTGKARAAIRKATRAAARKQFAGLGREIVEKMLAKLGKSYVEKEVSTAIPRLGHKNVDDALAAIGKGELSAIDVMKAMGLTIDDTKLKELRRRSPARKSDGDELSIPVRGVSRTMALKISPETGAVPGERIVGIIMPGAGITIYPIFAKALEQFDNQPERWVDLAWDTGAEEQRYPARIKVSILNEVGSLAQVAQVISDQGGNIDALQMVAREGARDFFDLDITLEVHDLKHLNEIMAGLMSRSAVSDVTRKTG